MNRRPLRVAIAACLASLGLVACGGTGSADAEPGAVTVALSGDLSTLDPSRTSAGPDVAVFSQIYETLLVIDTETDELEPRLATSWELVDPRTWEFKLRDDVEFSNGEPFDAESVIYSIKRYQDAASPAASALASVTSVTAPDPYTVRIQTKAPNPDLPRNMQGYGGAGSVFMLPAAYFSESSDDDIAGEPVGTGPYTLKEWQRGQYAELAQNPDYWGEKPEVENATFRFIAEPSTRVDALSAGEVDLAFDLPITSVEAVESADGTHVESTENGLVLTLLVDMFEPPFDDIRVRQAFAMALDVQLYTDTLLEGTATPLGTQLPETVPQANTDLEPYPFDPEKATELMAEAGYTPENPLVLETNTFAGRYPADSEVFDAIGSSLGEVGFEVEATPTEFSRLVAQMEDGTAGPFYICGFNYGSGLASKMNTFALSTSSWNMVDVPEYDRLVEQAGTTTDEAENAQLWKDAQQVLHDAYAIPAQYQLTSQFGASDRISWQPYFGTELDLRSVTFS